MVLFLRDFMNTDLNQVRGSKHGREALIMKGTFRKIFRMVKVYINGVIINYMKEVGKREN